MTDLWTIKDKGGNVTNPQIKASEEFVSANFDHYAPYVFPAQPEPTEKETARAWRDQELKSTDYIVPLTDHPERDDYLKFREKLRNWPTLKSFPKTKPKL